MPIIFANKKFMVTGELRKKDTEQALLFEEKINLQMRLLQAANIWSGNESDNERIEKLEKEVADYTRLVHNERTDTTQLWQEVNVNSKLYFVIIYWIFNLVNMNQSKINFILNVGICSRARSDTSR